MDSRVICYTLYNSLNYGAYLQAFALKQALKDNLGINLYFMKNNVTHNFKGKSINKKIFKLISILKFSKHINKFNIAKSIHSFDVVIIGSDELWNLNNNTFDHKLEFFGKNINCKYIMSYAVSSNGTKWHQIQEKYGKNTFSNIDFLSVRDKSTCNELKSFVHNKKIIEVLDPTFLLTDYRKYFLKIKSKKIKSNYMLVYAYKLTLEEIDEIKKFSKDNGLEVYSVGLYQEEFININASPFEFLQYVDNAKYVVTTTFHGTIFSIIFKKKFACYAGNNVKVIELIKKFNLDDRIILNESLIKIKKDIDYNAVEKILIKERAKSIKFLSLIGDK